MYRQSIVIFIVGILDDDAVRMAALKVIFRVGCDGYILRISGVIVQLVRLCPSRGILIVVGCRDDDCRIFVVLPPATHSPYRPRERFYMV